METKSNNINEENAENIEVDVKEESILDKLNIFKKILKPLQVLIKIHIKIAARELKKDLARYIAGVISIFLAIIFIVIFFLILNVIIVMLFHLFLFSRVCETNISILFSIVSTACLNLILSLFLFLSANAQFKKPFMQDTKKLIQESIEEIKNK